MVSAQKQESRIIIFLSTEFSPDGMNEIEML